jgi:hypothetical protein
MNEAEWFENEPVDPAYEAYIEEMEKRHREGRPWPVGELLECYICLRECPDALIEKDDHGFPCVMRECVALGPVVNRADPTQSYKLSCGHYAI